MNPKDPNPGWWYLSFCHADRPEGDRFVGGCYVYAQSIDDAVRQAWRLKINPGGEVLTIKVPDTYKVPQHLRHKLISKAELEAEGPIQRMDTTGMKCGECGKVHAEGEHQ